MNKTSRILVAGSNGMVGSAMVRLLTQDGYENVIPATRSDVDFTNQQATHAFFNACKPDYVMVAAAKVGGIMANATQKASFITQNLQIQTNIIQYSYESGVKKLLFLGSSCIYPKLAKQPITEDQLMTGALEPTNDAYAIAKIAGLKMCQAYYEDYGFPAISLMPTNLYGPYDTFDQHTSHVIPAMMAKFHEAKTMYTLGNRVTLWGDGSPRREFLHVDDLVAACLLCMQSYHSPLPINIGTGVDIQIKELASMMADIVGYTGDIDWDISRPNGTPRKVLNIDQITALGWRPRIELRAGLQSTYEWYKINK